MGRDPFRGTYGVHIFPREICAGAESLNTSSSSSSLGSKSSQLIKNSVDGGIISAVSLQRTFFFTEALDESRRNKQLGFAVEFDEVFDVDDSFLSFSQLTISFVVIIFSSSLTSL